MALQEIGDLSKYKARYDYTAYLSRRDWAYEHLRRVPAFEAAAWKAQGQDISKSVACHDIVVLKLNAPQPDAEAWGLKFFPNPSVPAPKAHVFWTDDIHLDKVRVKVSLRIPGEIDRMYQQTVEKCHIVHLTDWEGVEHLITRGKGCSVQSRCFGHSLLTTNPVKMTFDVEGLEDIDQLKDTLERSHQVFGDHMTSPPTFSRKARLMRNGLIALDGRRSGLSDRQIAWIIDGKDKVEDALARGNRSWIKRVPTYREAAQAICDGGFRDLLAPRIKVADPQHEQVHG